MFFLLNSQREERGNEFAAKGSKNALESSERPARVSGKRDKTDSERGPSRGTATRQLRKKEGGVRRSPSVIIGKGNWSACLHKPLERGKVGGVRVRGWRP